MMFSNHNALRKQQKVLLFKDISHYTLTAIFLSTDHCENPQQLPSCFTINKGFFF